VFTDGHEVRIR